MKGTINWDKMDSLGWIQDNSAIESIIRKHNLEVSELLPDHPDFRLGRYWLETCGTHSAINCLEAIGKIPETISGIWLPRLPDILSLFMNDPNNAELLQEAEHDFDPSTGMGNEYSMLYPISVKSVFGVELQYDTNKDWQHWIDIVSDGHSIQFCSINPGHYRAIVAFDETTNEFIVVDPWKGNPGLKGQDWWQYRMNQEEFDSNVKSYAIIY